MPRLISMKKIISIRAQHVSHGSYTKKQNSRFMLHLSSQSQKKEYVNQLESLILMQLRDHHFSSARNALNVETVYCSRTCNLGENDQTNPGKKKPTQVVWDCKPPQRRPWSLNPALIPKSNQGAMVPTFNGFFVQNHTLIPLLIFLWPWNH